MQQLNYVQGSEEWHTFRNKHIGSSDAAVCVLGLHYETTPYMLYMQKMGKAEPKKTTSAMYNGKVNEEPARRCFEDQLGVSVFPTVRESRTTHFMAASLDGLDIDEKVAVEIKCPVNENSTYHQMALQGQVPEHHMPQLQHQISVLELERIYFFSYTQSSNAIVEVKRDETYIKNMIQKETIFWEHVDKKNPPPLTEKDYLYCDTNEWKELTDEWIQLDYLEDRKEQIRRRLIEIAGQKNTKGNGVTVSKTQRKGNVVYSEIPYLKTIDLDQYRSPPTEIWRITTK